MGEDIVGSILLRQQGLAAILSEAYKLLLRFADGRAGVML